ncbi:MAG: DUF977 family protein [Patescibacteria group bacterium]
MPEEQPAESASQDMSKDSEENNLKVEETKESEPEVIPESEVAHEAEPVEDIAAPSQEVDPITAPQKAAESSPAPTPTPTQEPAPTIIAPAEIKESVPFMMKFLEHLGVLRKQANLKRREEMEKRLMAILEYAREHGQVTNDEVEKITGVGDRQALNYLNILVKQGKLVRFGQGLGTIYKSKS